MLLPEIADGAKPGGQGDGLGAAVVIGHRDRLAVVFPPAALEILPVHVLVGGGDGQRGIFQVLARPGIDPAGGLVVVGADAVGVVVEPVSVAAQGPVQAVGEEIIPGLAVGGEKVVQRPAEELLTVGADHHGGLVIKLHEHARGAGRDVGGDAALKELPGVPRAVLGGDAHAGIILAVLILGGAQQQPHGQVGVPVGARIVPGGDHDAVIDRVGEDGAVGGAQAVEGLGIAILKFLVLVGGVVDAYPHLAAEIGDDGAVALRGGEVGERPVGNAAGDHRPVRGGDLVPVGDKDAAACVRVLRRRGGGRCAGRLAARGGGRGVAAGAGCGALAGAQGQQHAAQQQGKSAALHLTSPPKRRHSPAWPPASAPPRRGSSGRGRR